MSNLKNIRQDFPIFSRTINGYPLAYLDNAATTQKPQVVLDAISDFYKNHNANIHRGVHTLSTEATNLYDEARYTVANFIKASFEEIIFTKNTTESLNLIAYSYALNNLKEGDEIILTQAEHHSNIVPWQIIAQKTKAKLKFIQLNDQGELLLDDSQKTESSASDQFGSLKRLLSPKTKILSLAHISNVLGTINPVKQIIKIAKKYNPQIITIIDAAQSAPHLQISVKDLNCDFLAFSSHKMCGPLGIGVLYGKKILLENMIPFLGGGDMISQVYWDDAKYAQLPSKFEAGTPNVAGAIGLAAAIKYLNSLGLSQIQTHENQLIEYLWQKLIQIPELTVYGPTNLSKRSSLISFNLNNVHAHDVAQILDSNGVAVRSGQHCCMPLHGLLHTIATVRASVYLYNSQEDIDQLLMGLKKVREIFK
jgi:cysteine desulfurase/selenocysteine lyase